jgi:hypothetical protein
MVWTDVTFPAKAELLQLQAVDPLLPDVPTTNPTKQFVILHACMMRDAALVTE